MISIVAAVFLAVAGVSGWIARRDDHKWRELRLRDDVPPI